MSVSVLKITIVIDTPGATFRGRKMILVTPEGKSLTASYSEANKSVQFFSFLVSYLMYQVSAVF